MSKSICFMIELIFRSQKIIDPIKFPTLIIVPVGRVGNSIFWSSIFWSVQSLKKIDCDRMSLISLLKRSMGAIWSFNDWIDLSITKNNWFDRKIPNPGFWLLHYSMYRYSRERCVLVIIGITVQPSEVLTCYIPNVVTKTGIQFLFLLLHRERCLFNST